jgi:hypothetical protein
MLSRRLRMLLIVSLLTYAGYGQTINLTGPPTACPNTATGPYSLSVSVPITFLGWEIVSGSGTATGGKTSGSVTWTSTGVGTLRANFRYGPPSNETDAADINVTVANTQRFTVTGGGYQCMEYLSPHLEGTEAGVSYQLFLNGAPYGSPMIGNGNAMSFFTNASGEHIFTIFPEGNYTVSATKPGCAAVSMLNSIDIHNVPLPVAFNAGGGTYCASSNQGATITLSGSEGSDVTYSLSYYSSSMLNPFSPQTGTGNQLMWGGLTAGTYYIWARRTVPGSPYQPCDTKMNLAATVTTFSTTTPFGVSGGGHYCQGGQGVSIQLNNSIPANTGWKYWLYRDNVSSSNPKSGAGGDANSDGSITWSNVTVAGTYAIVAVPPGAQPPAGSITGCNTLMSNTVQVVVDPLPTPFTVSGGSSCDGSTAFIQLSNSQSPAHYQLFLNGAPYGLSKSGGNGAITWNQTIVAGTYTIQATFDDTGCTGPMTGQKIIATGVSLSQFNLTTQNNCNGTLGGTISLDGSEPTVSYQLYKDGVAVGNPISVSSPTLPTWTATTRNGIYTATAISTTGCVKTMNGAPTITNPILDILPTKYPCTYYFAPSVTQVNDCAITAYSWNFGDGSTSTSPDPFHAYAGNGNFTVTLQVTMVCGTNAPCNLTVSKPITVSPFTYTDLVVQVHTDRKLQVITTSASTFSDSWALPYEDASLSNKNEFESCERGVWRNQGSYVYSAQRNQSSPVNTAADGTFTLDQFNWQQASLEAIPNWIKATTSTQYSPFSYELEEKDVLNIYSANLYDYGGHVPSASGSNMRNNEMAYTGFEYLTGNSSGNWVVGTQPTQTFFTYKVFSGFNHMAVVEADASQFTGINSVDVLASGINTMSFRGPTQKFIVNDLIVCRQPYTANTNFTTIVLNDAPFSGVWTGTIIVRKTVNPLVVATIDNAVSHTGASSLKITANQTFSQPLLSLDQGKSYMVSAWVSINNVSVTSPQLGTNIGLDLVIKDNAGVVQGTFPFQASGPVIEGWQQVKGNFVCPIAQSKMEITFRPGSASTVWFDDLRLHPNNGNMKAYVYDLRDYRLTAILDEENFASLFYYDAEGNLFLSKKETERGRKTISENITHLKQN